MRARRTAALAVALLVVGGGLAARPAGTGATAGAPPADSAEAAPDVDLVKAAHARAAARITGRYDSWFRKYTKRYFGPGMDWRLFKSQGVAESELNPNAVSRVGARGLMQLMPATFAQIATAAHWRWTVDTPEANIAAGILYDRDLWTAWAPKVADDEVPRFTFASYNAGEGTIHRAVGVAAAEKLDPARWASVARVAPKVRNWRHAETIGYVQKIEATYAILKEAR